jgi:hypothetical protein
MRAYTVHAPPGEFAPERFAFIKDGFSWPALIFGLLWVLWHRLWLTALIYLAAVLLLAWSGGLAGDDITTALGILGALLFASEANNIRRFALRRRGWRELGGARGDSLEEAEIDFFSRWQNAAGTPRTEPGAPPSRPEEAADRADHDGPIFGLFPEPDR